MNTRSISSVWILRIFAILPVGLVLNKFGALATLDKQKLKTGFGALHCNVIGSVWISSVGISTIGSASGTATSEMGTPKRVKALQSALRIVPAYLQNLK